MSTILQAVGLQKKPDPLNQAKEWQRKIKREMRGADREIKDLTREEEKFIKECRRTASLGARAGSAVRTTAKNVVMARRAKERACTTRAQLNSVSMTLTQQIGMIKVAKCMQKSTDVMKAMNDAVKLPALNAQMREMAREMERAGLIEELVGDAMDDVMGGEDLESEADAEVEKVLAELAVGTFAGVSDVASKELPGGRVEEEVQEEDEKEKEEMDDMKARLQAL
mmetsp:Transcript_8143/g.16991  ORF Transcript_8143/g.16991 Transcript_8143/m.16991 type:complete len:225 (+) Transcript_8143:49-723(+)